jgi:hypothetical protein
MGAGNCLPCLPTCLPASVCVCVCNVVVELVGGSQFINCSCERESVVVMATSYDVVQSFYSLVVLWEKIISCTLSAKKIK